MLNNKSKEILEFIKHHPLSSSKVIFESLSSKSSYATVKRILAKLISENLITAKGKGRGTKYFISSSYELFYPIDVDQYYQKEIDERLIKEKFNFSLIAEVLSKVNLFTEEELKHLNKLQKTYESNIEKLTKFEYEKELQRLSIDLSWKSSQIEGNTYSLLETERLLSEMETASGKSKDEATMLLNHKHAIDFITENPDYIHPLTVSKVEDIHSILVKDLAIDRNIRKRRVGISGTNYRPLENEFQIKESLTDMCDLVNRRKNIFEKAFLVLILISYIQPFADGNKRTARIMSNAILINNKYCPISFRTVDSIDYKKAMLIFYEQNNMNSFKDVFISQFKFAVDTYF